MLLVYLLFVLVFIILGNVFSSGKASFLIAGYNTSSKEKKAKIDENKLCRFMGKLMYFFAACWAIMALGEIFKAIIFLFWVGLVLFIVAAIAAVIYMTIGNRFKK